MGVYNTTYFGIYLEIPFLECTKTETFYVHPETGKRQQNRFDANTGRENTLKSEEKIVHVEPNAYIDDVDGLDEDMFFRPAYTNGGKRIQTFVLNCRSKFSSSDSDLFNLDVSNIDIPKLIEEFKVEYKKYLDYYISEYEVVNVKYGVVNYAH